MRRLAEEVLYFQESMHQYEDTLTANLESWTSKLTSRLLNASRNLDDVRLRYNRNEIDFREAQQAIVISLEETQLALRNALERAVALEEENQDLRISLDTVLQEKMTVERALEGTRQSLEETEVLARSRQENVGVEDFAKLMEKLEAAEIRAQETATESAQAFADSARTIAFLESELTRVKTLVDHLRCVNVKLQDDMKVAHLEGVKVRYALDCFYLV